MYQTQYWVYLMLLTIPIDPRYYFPHFKDEKLDVRYSTAWPSHMVVSQDFHSGAGWVFSYGPHEHAPPGHRSQSSLVYVTY